MRGFCHRCTRKQREWEGSNLGWSITWMWLKSETKDIAVRLHVSERSHLQCSWDVTVPCQKVFISGLIPLRHCFLYVKLDFKKHLFLHIFI